jgi:hypothetical protein
VDVEHRKRGHRLALAIGIGEDLLLLRADIAPVAGMAAQIVEIHRRVRLVRIDREAVGVAGDGVGDVALLPERAGQIDIGDTQLRLQRDSPAI